MARWPYINRPLSFMLTGQSRLLLQGSLHDVFLARKLDCSLSGSISLPSHKLRTMLIGCHGDLKPISKIDCKPDTQKLNSSLAIIISSNLDVEGGGKGKREKNHLTIKATSVWSFAITLSSWLIHHSEASSMCIYLPLIAMCWRFTMVKLDLGLITMLLNKRAQILSFWTGGPFLNLLKFH